MKKKILLVLMAMMMCVTSVCLASNNSKLFENEEKTGNLAVQVIAGTTAPDTLSPLCEPAFAKENLKASKLNADRKQIKDLIGTLKEVNFVQLTKLAVVDNNTKVTTPIDRVTFIAVGNKNVSMICNFDFSIAGKKPLLLNAAFNVQQPAAPKK